MKQHRKSAAPRDSSNLGDSCEAMGEAIAGWEMAEGRHLPWREATGVYPLALAEVLLQKTKAADVEPVWRTVVSRYPTATALAAAGSEDLRCLVAGLGLGHQRVERLQAMARALSMEPVPDRVPGLGPYGSAVVALAAGLAPSSPPVDGNVARVICRLLGLSFERGEPRKKPEVKAAVSELLATQPGRAEQLVIAYGLVDLGATLCTPHHPDHEGCPLAPWCAAFQNSSEIEAER